MRCTLQDVAAKTGLSTATVRQIFNGRAHRFSEKTQARVRAAAMELGYLPNSAARSVRQGRFNTVGLLLRHSGSAQDYNILKGVYAACVRKGLHVAYAETEDCHFDDPEAMPRHLCERCVDGYVVHHGMDLDPSVISVLHRIGVPIVWINARSEKNAVRPDDGGGVRLAVDHLRNRGHRFLGWIGASVRHDLAITFPFLPHYSAMERLRAFEAACKAAQVESAVLNGSYGSYDDLVHGVVSFLLDSGVTGVVTNGFVLTPELLLRAQQMGLAIVDLPETVSFVTGQPVNTPGLEQWILRVPAQEMGVAAVEMLLELMRDPAQDMGAVVVPYVLEAMRGAEVMPWA